LLAPRPTAQPVARPARLLSGLDSVWIAEHHFITYGICPSATAFAANILGRTGIRRLLLMVEGTGELRHTLGTIDRLGTEVAPGLTGQHP